MRGAFRDNSRQSPSQFREEGPDRHSHEWAPKLKMSDLGPLVVGFVEAGLSALDTPDTTETVRRAPQNDGRSARVRGPETQLRVRTVLATELLEGLSVTFLLRWGRRRRVTTTNRQFLSLTTTTAQLQVLTTTTKVTTT